MAHAAATPEPPRPLTPAERAVIEHLLSPDFPGVEELRAQVPHARVRARCGCGCPTIDLVVDREAMLAATGGLRPFPLGPETAGARGGWSTLVVEARTRGIAPGTEAMLFVSADGWLECLELVPYAEPPPDRFPPPSDLGAPIVHPPWGGGWRDWDPGEDPL
jgi:hypothetical protein